MKLHLENFQSHRDTWLDLVSGINAIVGESGAGKSSVMRAIDWLVNNRPSGDDFISHWGGDCCVTFIDDNGTQVSRLKGKGKNQYIVNNQVYEGFNREVPEVVQKALNIQDYNLRLQHQGPFLLGESSGEVSRYFNKVARLDLIDKTVSNIEVMLRKEKNELQIEQRAIVQLDIALLKFATLPDIEQDTVALEIQETEIQGKVNKYNGILDLTEERAKIVTDIESVKKIAALKLDVIAAVQKEDKIQKLSSKYIALDELERQASSAAEQLGQTQKIAELRPGVIVAAQKADKIIILMKRRGSIDLLARQISVESVKLAEQNNIRRLRAQVSKAVILMDKCQELFKNKVALMDLVNQVNSVQENLKNVLRDIIILRKQFNKMMPDTCPLCGQGVK